MSVPVIWETTSCPIRLVGAGKELSDGRTVDDRALLLGDGTGVFVAIEGNADDLVGFAQRVNNAVAECGDLPRGPFPTNRGQWHLTNKAILATGPSAPPTFTHPTCADRILALDWGPDGQLSPRQICARLPNIATATIRNALVRLVDDGTLVHESYGVYHYSASTG